MGLSDEDIDLVTEYLIPKGFLNGDSKTEKKGGVTEYLIPKGFLN